EHRLGRGRRVVGVEQWAEIRRMHRVERLSIRGPGRRTGLHRKTVRRALAAETPPGVLQGAGRVEADPFWDWICAQLRADPGVARQADVPAHRLSTRRAGAVRSVGAARA